MNGVEGVRKGLAGFDPFSNRLSRDLRNTMSEALLACLDAHDPAPIEVAATAFRHHPDLNADQAAYLEMRLACYRAVLKQALPANAPDTIALLFWDHQLFFEFHELLERRWLAADGPEKEILQGLIRAAGTFVHRQSGNMAGAEKMAARARETIRKYRYCLPPGFAAKPLLTALADPAVPPPRFGRLAPTDRPCRHGAGRP